MVSGWQPLTQAVRFMSTTCANLRYFFKHGQISIWSCGWRMTTINTVVLQVHCTIPVYNSCPTAIAINPANSNLVTVHADQHVSDAISFFFTPGCPGINLSLALNTPRVLRCRSLSTRCYTKSTRSGVDGCRKTDCTPCGWPETHPSPTWASVQKIQLTSWCTTCSCSASLTRLWYAKTVQTLCNLLFVCFLVCLTSEGN